MAAAMRGDIARVADMSFDCIMCGLCVSRCPAEEAQYNIAILCRRLYGRNLAPKAQHLAQRVAEIDAGKLRRGPGQDESDARRRAAPGLQHARHRAGIETAAHHVLPDRTAACNRSKTMKLEGYTPYPCASRSTRVVATRPARLHETWPMHDARPTSRRSCASSTPTSSRKAMRELRVGPNKGGRTPHELADLLEGHSRLRSPTLDLEQVDYRHRRADHRRRRGGLGGGAAGPRAGRQGAHGHQAAPRRRQHHDGPGRHPGRRQGQRLARPTTTWT